jgi:hypothetical protein
MRRRTFIEGIAVLAAARPLAARAQQQVERMRLIGMLMLYKAATAGEHVYRRNRKSLRSRSHGAGGRLRNATDPWHHLDCSGQPCQRGPDRAALFMRRRRHIIKVVDPDWDYFSSSDCCIARDRAAASPAAP